MSEAAWGGAGEAEGKGGWALRIGRCELGSIPAGNWDTDLALGRGGWDNVKRKLAHAMILGVPQTSTGDSQPAGGAHGGSRGCSVFRMTCPRGIEVQSCTNHLHGSDEHGTRDAHRTRDTIHTRSI